MSAVPVTFPDSLLERARREAAESGRRAVDLLEEAAGLAPDEFIAALAARVRIPAFGIRELDAYAPDFAALETESFIILPWDREIIVDGELVVRPDYAEKLRALGE